jgi:hypothetical protein
MVPSSSHAKVETLTIALTEVTSATADGILALILKVLRDQNVCAPRLYRFWILKCLAVPCIFYILPHHHNAVLYYLLNIESPLRADFALPLLPFRAQFLVSVVPKLYRPPPPTHKFLGARDAYVRCFKWEAEIKATDPRGVDKSKAIFLRGQLVDNETFVWLYFFWRT